MRSALLLVLAFAASISTASAISEENSLGWLRGAWTAVADEDGTPADVMAFDAAGKHVNYGIQCHTRTEMSYHVHHGDVYVTGEVPGKGPIALVFRPNIDKSRLVYTSPRTRHNATYARLAINPCEK